MKPDGSFDREIVDLLQEARITTLRFPGGTAADFFHWWQALGPHSRRPKLSSGYLGEFYSPVVGPDEFIKLATALKAVPFVTANTGTGSAEEAAALARFFKSRGFPAVYWEVGNEVYFEGLSDNGQIGLPPDVYARRVIEYAVAIRKEAPYAKIFSAAVIGPEEQDSFWNSVVLGLAGPYVDGISVHNAYFPLYAYRPDRTIPSDDELFTSMLGATKAVERSHDRSRGPAQEARKADSDLRHRVRRDLLPRQDRRGPRPHPAAESDAGLRPLQRERPERLRAARAGPRGASHVARGANGSAASSGRRAAPTYRNPQFYVHREYAREAGNLVMEASVDPTDAVFSSNAIALIPGQTNVPMLDAVATRDPAGTRYALFVVNRSLTATVHTSVSLDVPAGLTGTVSVLTGPGAGARNDAENPTRVSLRTGTFARRVVLLVRLPASLPHDLPLGRRPPAAPAERPSQPLGSDAVASPPPLRRGSVGPS